MTNLGTEAIEGTARTLEGIYNIKSSDGFPTSAKLDCAQHVKGYKVIFSPLGVFGVSDRVTDDLGIRNQGGTGMAVRIMTHVLKENLQNTTGLLIDETRDTLYTTTTSEATNGLQSSGGS